MKKHLEKFEEKIEEIKEFKYEVKDRSLRAKKWRGSYKMVSWFGGEHITKSNLKSLCQIQKMKHHCTRYLQDKEEEKGMKRRS